MDNLNQALKTIKKLVSENDITSLIRETEKQIINQNGSDISNFLSNNQNLNAEVLSASLDLKNITGQLNVIIHALGILVSLPHILKPDEKIINTSLGAGNTGKKFDLETNERIAEFKFIQWRGGSEAIRQKGLFKDFFYLAEEDTNKKKYLYLLDTDIPLKFLQGNTAINSLVSRNKTLDNAFHYKHNNKFKTISEYYKKHKNCVKIVNLKTIVPAFK